VCEPKNRTVTEQKQIPQRFDPRLGVNLIQPLAKANFLSDEILPLLDEFIVRDELSKAQTRQVVQYSPTVNQRQFD
jgi:hypothetical protein